MRIVITVMLAVALAGCGHREKKAPCSPMVTAFAPTLNPPEPFNTPQFTGDRCGEARPVNGSITFSAPKKD